MNKTPSIGQTTSTLDKKQWYKELEDIKVLEIGRRSARFFLDPEWINKIKPYLKGIDLSMHSATTKVFTDNQQFTETELSTLKSEVLCCKMIGAKELIFHLNNDKLTDEQEKQIREVINFAKEHGIDMIYESNGILVAEIALDFLNRFPDVNYNLDLGHLNNGLGRDMLGLNLEEFIAMVKGRVIYVHSHSNNGKKDNHKALRDGTLDWKHVLDLLDLKMVRKIITETRTKEDVRHDIEDLRGYLKK